MSINFEVGPQIVLSYKRLSYKPWYALAEFIDNSTQAYFDHEDELAPALNQEGQILTVDIKSDNDSIEINDNSMGMSEEDLKKALAIGIPPDNTTGRSKYGLGMKTAAFWFGNRIKIVTKKLGSPQEITLQLDVEDIANGLKEVDIQVKEVMPTLHYTNIIITDLNRRIAYKSKTKVIDYLPSFYRVDISNGKLKLFFNGAPLRWSKDELLNKLDTFADGSPASNEVDIEVAGHQVRGWAGVLKKGSRRNAGFSLLQSNRAIKSWPDSFKNESIFGSQEGGSNNLINQRLTGELYVDGFDVSHTKDEILFTDHELDELDSKLAETLKPIIHYANTRRKEKNADVDEKEKFTQLAIEFLEKELGSPEFINAYNYEVELPEEVVQAEKTIYLEQVTKSLTPSKEFKVGRITITLYLVNDGSIRDYYLTVQPKGKRELIIIVNRLHPHWEQLETEDSVLNFLRHCIYDGLAEWKASDREGKIDPDTVKILKDEFLRIQFQMDIHSQPTVAVSEEVGEESDAELADED